MPSQDFILNNSANNKSVLKSFKEIDRKYEDLDNKVIKVKVDSLNVSGSHYNRTL